MDPKRTNKAQARRRAAKRAHDSLTVPGYSRADACELMRKTVIKSIKIKGYRGFSDFSMSGLGRINLLVGRNNSGKTSILEALQILASGHDLTPLWRILSRRGEQIVPEVSQTRGISFEVELSHLFTGHEVKNGAELSVTTTNEQPRAIKFRIQEAKANENPVLFAQMAHDEPAGSLIALKISGTPTFSLPPIPLTGRGTLRQDTFQQASQMHRVQKQEGGAVQFITSESLPGAELLNLWNSIVLTPDEERVVTALKFLEPKIERIAAITSPYVFAGGANRGGFVLRLQGSDKRLPIGSFGDGMWRILALATAISKARDSLLLVDEIDTGLHHTVMADMWKLIDSASKLFNVQVFATTHSTDCVESLATICSSDVSQNDITIQRVEAGRTASVPFSESEVKIAAERHIEIR